MLVEEYKKQTSTLENSVSYKILIIFGMVYLSIMICNAILTNKYMGSDEFFILGGTLTSPFIFILDDIVAEIYGYKITRCMILSGFAAQTLFTLICEMVILAPSPSFFKAQTTYASILGSSLMWINFSGFIAYISANLINSYILTQWKILLKGKKFWLRSLGSSAFSEIIYSVIAILFMEIHTLPLKTILKIIALSYLIKITYSIAFAGPGQLLVTYLKKRSGIDVYDLPRKFTPFEYLNQEK